RRNLLGHILLLRGRQYQRPLDAQPFSLWNNLINCANTKHHTYGQTRVSKSLHHALAGVKVKSQSTRQCGPLTPCASSGPSTQRKSATKLGFTPKTASWSK